MSMFSLAQKTAMITGGGSGIGKAISKLFAKQGAHVIILDLDQKGGANTVAEISSMGGQSQFLSCNVAIESEVQNIIGTIPVVDILVNNAGIAHVGNAENTKAADLDPPVLS